MEWALAAAGIIGAIIAAGLFATRRGSPVEMPGGETIFDAPPQPEQPSALIRCENGCFGGRERMKKPRPSRRAASRAALAR